MSFTPDTPTTEEVLAAVLESPVPTLPAQEQKYGSTIVSWWETDPGYVYIHTEGGTPDDRHYASTLVALQLAPHGYKRAQFDLDEMVHQATKHRTAGWPDIMAKAKRLIQSGQVQVLRNGYNIVMGHVIGDHGSYDTEISRDDPQSRAITGWQCSCPWDQYAWQRTRKWKKFEGRPCSHVMALYWKALGTPLDEQLSEEQAAGMGTGQKIGPPAPGQPDSHNFDMHPRSFGPEGDILQGEQMELGLPGDATGRQGPAQAPLAPPPGPAATPMGPTAPGVLPPFPGEQMQMEWQGPGTTPGGQQSPPGAFTVPGAKPQSPANPIQNPGTYSKVGSDDTLRRLIDELSQVPGVRAVMEVPNEEIQYQPGDRVTMGYANPSPRSEFGLPGEGHICPNTGTVVNVREPGDHLVDQDSKSDMGWGPYGGRWVSHDAPSYDVQWDLGASPDFTSYHEPGAIGEAIEQRRLWPEGHENVLNAAVPMQSPDYPPSHWARLGAQFEAPQVVRLVNSIYGLAQGPIQGQNGDGEYREVLPTKPNGQPTLGEVMSQDPTTGWVEVLFPLDDSGPGEPYHVQVFCEPSDIEPASETNAFIRRH